MMHLPLLIVSITTMIVAQGNTPEEVKLFRKRHKDEGGKAFGQGRRPGKGRDFDSTEELFPEPLMIPEGDETLPNPVLSSDPLVRNIEDTDGIWTTYSCCRPRFPKCCPFGTEMLWEVGDRGFQTVPGAVAQQPSVFNPECLGSVDFDTPPSNVGQPFCHEIALGAAAPATVQSAQLELILHSAPPCNKRDRLCLTTSSGRDWCTMLEAGSNRLCLDLHELDLLDGAMSALLVRVAFHSTVDYLRLHAVMCQPVSGVPPVSVGASMHFEFTNVLASSISGVPPFTYTPGPASFVSGGPRGTSVVFPPGPAKMLQAANHQSQQGGTEMTLAAWVFYDEPGASSLQGLPLVTKLGSYRWMVNPGKEWYWQHVHLGPGFGAKAHASSRSSDPAFTIPVQKWLCLAVTISVDLSLGQTTLHYYLNGELWGPPTVQYLNYTMDGTSDLYINTNSDFSYWKGKMDSFTMWKSVLTAQEVNHYCNCDA